MNSVGIDVSKGKSMIAVMRPFGEVGCSPFEVPHTSSELSTLAKQLKSLDGETRVVMEATGNYHLPIAVALHEAGIYVSVVNANPVHTLLAGRRFKKETRSGLDWSTHFALHNFRNSYLTFVSRSFILFSGDWGTESLKE